MIGEVLLNTALLLAELDHRADKFRRHEDRHRIDRLADFLNTVNRREFRRVLDLDDGAVSKLHFIHHGRCRRDEVLVVLTLQALLHDIHVKKTEEPGAETEAERLGDFRLKVQRRVIQLELLQRVAERIVFRGFNRVETREHLRLHLLEAGGRIGRRVLRERHRVTDTGVTDFLDARDDEAHFARLQHFARRGSRRKDTELLHEMRRAGRHQLDLILHVKRSFLHADQHHNAHIAVVPGVDHEGLQFPVAVTRGRRNPLHDGFQNVVHAHAGLRGAEDRVIGLNTDHVLDFLTRGIRLRGRQVHLIQHRYHGDPEVNRGVAVRDSLRLNALRRVNDEQRSFAGGKRTRNFIRKVDVPGSIDQVQFIDLSVLRLVAQRRRLGFDRDAALTLEIHRVEHLALHLTVREAAAAFDQTVGQRRFAVVDMGNNGKITDILHVCIVNRPQGSGSRIRLHPAARQRTRIRVSEAALPLV